MTQVPTQPDLCRALGADCLTVLGTFAITQDDALPIATGTLLLIGPDEPKFWPHFTASPEYRDGQPDPLDRWSTRVIGAAAHNHPVVYPFGGPPWHPFIGWALRSGRCFSSPVGFLAHAGRGLFFSVRAAILVPWQVETPATASPCTACPQPCKTACPVGALTADGYDVAACKAHISAPEGAACRQTGCAVRRACPVGADLRLPVQSAFHMAAFAPNSKAPI